MLIALLFLLLLVGSIYILALGRGPDRQSHKPSQDLLDSLLDQIADNTDFMFPADRTPEQRREDAKMMLLMIMDEDLEEEMRDDDW